MRRILAAFAAATLACGAVLAVVPVGPAGTPGATTPLFGTSGPADAAAHLAPSVTATPRGEAERGASDDDATGLAAPAFTALWTAKASAPTAPAAHERTALRARSSRPARPARRARTGRPAPARPRDRAQRWYARRNLDGG